MTTPETTLTGERGEILQILAEQRNTLLITVRKITDAQAAERTTVSDLTLGGPWLVISPGGAKSGWRRWTSCVQPGSCIATSRAAGRSG